jgi:hypothetical protein
VHRFVEKVELERQVLRVVNSSLGSPQLPGLSEIAIFAWEAADRSARGAVAKKLLRLSALMLSLCERSGGRLEAEYAVAQDEVIAALAELSSFVAQLTEAAAQHTPRLGR